MTNWVLAAYVAADAAFVFTGAVMMGFSAVVQSVMSEMPTEGEQAARNLLYQRFPLTGRTCWRDSDGGKFEGSFRLTCCTAGMVNAAFIFLAFLLTIPGIITPTRGWLKFSSFWVLLCGVFSLILGLYLWILTLKTKEDFGLQWNTQPSAVQELMQTRVSDKSWIFFSVW